ncbi:MAG: acyl carrier protein [Bacilli bacterium]
MNKEKRSMVFEKVRDIIAKELDVDASKITMDTHIIDDLGADSLDAVELIMAIEDEFGIQVDDESAQKVKRISDLVYYIEEALK